jgi:hypothetical protein
MFDSIVVSIPRCHRGDPGSIPGRADNLLSRRGAPNLLLFPEEVDRVIVEDLLLFPAGAEE